jgi:hypothetical protein
MSKTITALKRAAKVAADEIIRPHKFEVGDNPVICSMCGSDGFKWHGHGMAGTRIQASRHRGICVAVLPVQSP